MLVVLVPRDISCEIECICRSALISMLSIKRVKWRALHDDRSRQKVLWTADFGRPEAIFSHSAVDFVESVECRCAACHSLTCLFESRV